MRSRYLWLLAHVCHLSPADLDDLGFVDFLSLASASEEWLKRSGGLGG